jgi:5-methylthioribose kinase
MHSIDSQNAADYLRSTGHVAAGEPIQVRELAGGVSNIVLLVTLPVRGERFVLKQARERLRVQEEWLCPVERIWRELDVLKAYSSILESSDIDLGSWNGGPHVQSIRCAVPSVLWEDRENFLYAMTAAPQDHETWKELLLAGTSETSLYITLACGQLLGSLHARSWRSPIIAAHFDDRSYFEQLRVDPYYRQVARVHPDLAPAIERLIASLSENRRALVHGDFSPKNLLVWPGHVMLIDFEVGHYGDPAFDLGFFLTHLVLKSIRAGENGRNYLALATNFWRTYRKTLSTVVNDEELAALEQRMLLNLAGCLLARVDGKSPVDYLSVDGQRHARDLAQTWLMNAPASWSDAAYSVLSSQY